MVGNLWIKKVWASRIIKGCGRALSMQRIPKHTLPMKKSYSSLSHTEFAALVRKAVRQEKLMQPKESTLQFLKNLAHNYRIMPQVPDNLQGYVLS